MSLSINSKYSIEKEMWIIEPKGDLDIYTSKKFKEEILKSYKTKETDIIIEGSNLDYVDSTGLGALISLLKTLKESEKKIYIYNLKSNIRKIFDITQLDKLFIIRGEGDE